VVLDIDPDKGGEESLRQLEEQYEALPETVTVVSGGGGRHLYFQHPGGLVPTTSEKLGPGLDTRGDGGYIVASPSWHVSGQQYRWAPDKNPEQAPLAPFPAWLSDLLQGSHAQGEGSPPERRTIGAEIIPEGQRNATLPSLAGAMWRKGVSKETLVTALLNENDTRCTPPLSEAEVKGIACSVARYPRESGTPQEAKGSAAKVTPQPAARLRAQSARTLITKCLPSVRWVVPGLIPEGGNASRGGREDWQVMGGARSWACRGHW